MSHAAPARKSSAGGWRDGLHGQALRTTLAAVVAMALALALHVDQPALAVVFSLARGTAGAATMLAGGLAGVGLGLVLLALFDQSPAAFSLALFVATSLATYGALGRRFPYAFVQAELNLLILVGQALDAPTRALEPAFYGLASVAIAAFASFVTGASQPVGTPLRLQETLGALLAACGGLLRDRTAAPARAVQLELLMRNARALLAASWPTRQVSRRRWRALAAALEEVAAATRACLACDALRRAVRSPDRASALERERTELARDVDAAVPLVLPERPPRARLAERRAAAEAVSNSLRARDAGEEPALGPSGPGPGLLLALGRLAAVSPFLVPGAASAGGSDGQVVRRHRPVLDRFRARHAVKAAASYLLILWAWSWAGWGAIVPALVVAVLVATLATPLGATLTKATLRVGGVVAGGVVGLAMAIAVLPLVTSLPAICLLTGAALLLFLLVQQTHERLSFAGLQAAIAFTLTLVHGPGPPSSWRGPLDNLIGLAFGIGVVVLVMHAVWPIDASSSAHGALARLLARAGGRLDRVAPSDLAARRRAEAADHLDREHAAGFVHEVALYGTQFGRPAERLRELFLLVAEVDATLALGCSPVPRSDASPRPAPGGGGSVVPDALARDLGRACTAVARQIAARPGERDPAGARGAVAALEARLASLAEPARASGTPLPTRPPASTAAERRILDASRVVAALLVQLLDVVDAPASGRDVAVRAA